MALANRAPVSFTVNEEVTSASPSFKPRRLSLDKEVQPKKSILKSPKSVKAESNYDDEAVSPSHIRESTPEKSTSPSTDNMSDASPASTNPSSVSSQPTPPPPPVKEKKEKAPKEKKEKKEKKESTKALIAIGISTTIPVTGERPLPEKCDSIDDDVLYQIFTILYENDKDQKGMTVKQICDVLLESNPDTAQLSTKTSNLISAKLNAYVKRVEKGEKDLVYALSREWADASPKRMMYVYRGLLAPDYQEHALAAIESQRIANNNMASAAAATEDPTTTFPVNMPDKKSMFEGFDPDVHLVAPANHEMKRRATAFDLGIYRNTFTESVPLDLTLPQLTIPYSSAPVVGSLGSLSKFSMAKSGNYQAAVHNSLVANSAAILDYDLENMDAVRDNEEGDEDEDMDDFIGGSGPSFHHVKTIMRTVNKRSKSMSFIQNKKGCHSVTIAAASRFPRAQSNTQMDVVKSAGPVHPHGFDRESRLSISSHTARLTINDEPPIAPKWVKAVRDGFLTQDIGSPEDVSLAELDSMFS
ncbi:hypothetical protein WICPIJ_003726 [Wickerhamomyces pijperi]|uniref:GDS1 winged helix domain-containing protein n=1 Tax=Wickerhamomyces pijperi TaxID=599730 RepID=A0A9P8Q6X1_WICPI|nr:hypothetical protein WICPIJ_003726 [Wickerhamomyces pijperi]